MMLLVACSSSVGPRVDDLDARLAALEAARPGVSDEDVRRLDLRVAEHERGKATGQTDSLTVDPATGLVVPVASAAQAERCLKAGVDAVVVASRVPDGTWTGDGPWLDDLRASCGADLWVRWRAQAGGSVVDLVVARGPRLGEHIQVDQAGRISEAPRLVVPPTEDGWRRP